MQGRTVIAKEWYWYPLSMRTHMPLYLSEMIFSFLPSFNSKNLSPKYFITLYLEWMHKTIPTTGHPCTRMTFCSSKNFATMVHFWCNTYSWDLYVTHESQLNHFMNTMCCMQHSHQLAGIHSCALHLPLHQEEGTNIYRVKFCFVSRWIGENEHDDILGKSSAIFKIIRCKSISQIS